MASGQLLYYQRAASKIPPNPANAPETVAPPSLRIGRPFVMSINSAEYDRVFRRQQSAKMAALAWEREPHWKSWAAAICAAIFIIIVVFLATAL